MSIDFMVEMAWKSALISAFALAVAFALRSRPADERSGVLRLSVALVLGLPLIALLLPALPIVTRTVASAPPAASLPLQMALLAPDPLAAAPAPSLWDDPVPLLEAIWLAGAAVVMLRLAAGLATLARWTRGGSEVDSGEWRRRLDIAAAAAGFEGEVRLLVAEAPAPMSWGWLRPAILIDRETLLRIDQADSILAHELAHIVRRDWLVLILARLATALFWFNPLIWLLERKLVDTAEEAADARALAHVEPASYAQTLVSCARQAGRASLPATAIADRGLGRRVRAILGQRMRLAAPNPRLARLAMGVCVLAAAPIAALKPVTASVPPPAPRAPLAAEAEAPAEPVAPQAPAAAAAPATAAAPVATQAAIAEAAPPAPVAPTVRLAMAQAPRAPEPPIPPADAPPPPAAPEAAAPPMAPMAPAAPRARRAGPRAEGGYWTPEASAELGRTINGAVAEAMRAQAEALRQMHVELDRMHAGMDRNAIGLRNEQMRDAMRAREEALRLGAHAREEAMRQMSSERTAVIARATAEAKVAVRRGLAEGALGMERGAREMDAAAERLRSPQVRAEQIARDAREGRRTTDAELLAAIPKLHAGAEKLRAAAQRMRSEPRD